jgi:hypothetical protein
MDEPLNGTAIVTSQSARSAFPVRIGYTGGCEFDFPNRSTAITVPPFFDGLPGLVASTIVQPGVLPLAVEEDIKKLSKQFPGIDFRNNFSEVRPLGLEEPNAAVADLWVANCPEDLYRNRDNILTVLEVNSLETFRQALVLQDPAESWRVDFVGVAVDGRREVVIASTNGRAIFHPFAVEKLNEMSRCEFPFTGRLVMR